MHSFKLLNIMNFICHSKSKTLTQKDNVNVSNQSISTPYYHGDKLIVFVQILS